MTSLNPTVSSDVLPSQDDGFISISVSTPVLTASTPEELIERLNLLYDPLKGPVRINLLLHNGNQVCCYYVAQQVPNVHFGSQQELSLTQGAPLIMAQSHPHVSVPTHCGYEGFRSYCQLPLVTERGQLGAVEFFSDLDDHFCTSILARLTQFSAFIAIAVENVLDKSQVLEHAHSLRVERDNFRILVDVTNALIKQANVAALPVALFDVFKKSLSLSSLTLIEYQAPDHRCISYMVNEDHCETPLQFTHPCTAKACLKTHNQLREPLIVGNEDTFTCNPSCDCLTHLLPVSRTCFRLVQLQYRGYLCGCVIFSFPASVQPEMINPTLLEQIAARTALAMDNIRSHSASIMAPPPADSLRQAQILLEETTPDVAEHGIIYRSGVMAEVLRKIRMVADSDCSVLILGETGTGKELIAKAIHKLSQRSKHEMVNINCAAIPTGLIESDLFGHEKGAFTGALHQHTGRFERAHQSTLFLDEIGDMPLELQPKLLRVLQEQQVERIGSRAPVPVDVRLIAATNCDLLTMIQEKRFRSDLYYRLNVFPIVLPPLRERREDIPLLINHFVHKIARRMRRNITAIPTETMRVLVAQPWLGNIRELENVIERAVIMTTGSVLELLDEDLPSPVTRVQVCEPVMETEALSDDGAKQIIEALRACNGIVAGERGAARRLGIKRTTLLSRMKRLGISSKEFD